MSTVTERAKAASAARTPKTNIIGLEKNDYKGRDSTLCKGCGHDSISARIINATWALAVAAKRRPTSWARATALTRCTGVCLRSRPAPWLPTAN